MMIWKETTAKWFQIQNGGHNPSCLYKKNLAGNLYCSPNPAYFVAEIWWVDLWEKMGQVLAQRQGTISLRKVKAHVSNHV